MENVEATTPSLLDQIMEKEKLISELENQLSKEKYELIRMKEQNAQDVVIRWKESINWCITVDSENPYYFIKTPTYISKCIASKHGVEVTRDIKNKIATNLSQMFKQKLIGRIQHGGASYYGLTKFFKNDRITLKKEYEPLLEKVKERQ